MERPSWGLLPGSEEYFNTPSDLAKSVFFHWWSAGLYNCNSTYITDREQLDSHLLLYVAEGSGGLTYRGQTRRVAAGDLIFIDCRCPQVYWTDDGWQIHWLHFGGAQTAEMHDLLHCRFGAAVSVRSHPSIAGVFLSMFAAMARPGGAPEPLMSCYIHQVLAELFMLSGDAVVVRGQSSQLCLSAMAYIEASLAGRPTVSDMAAHVNLSPFHFSRWFKAETGYAPHEYLVKARLDRAKGLLRSTELSVKEVAFETGFASESHFCRTFQKRASLTPSDFRRLRL